jgi:hypothetical protein
LLPYTSSHLLTPQVTPFLPAWSSPAHELAICRLKAFDPKAGLWQKNKSSYPTRKLVRIPCSLTSVDVKMRVRAAPLMAAFSTAGVSSRHSSACRTNTTSTSNGTATGGSDNVAVIRVSGPSCSNRPYTSEQPTFPTNHSFGQDRPYSLERFVRDIDAREKVRLGTLKDIAHARGQGERGNGIVRDSNAIESGQYDSHKKAEGRNQTQVPRAREKE